MWVESLSTPDAQPETSFIFSSHSLILAIYAYSLLLHCSHCRPQYHLLLGSSLASPTSCPSIKHSPHKHWCALSSFTPTDSSLLLRQRRKRNFMFLSMTFRALLRLLTLLHTLLPITELQSCWFSVTHFSPTQWPSSFWEYSWFRSSCSPLSSNVTSWKHWSKVVPPTGLKWWWSPTTTSTHLASHCCVLWKELTLQSSHENKMNEYCLCFWVI